uniref:Pericentriolar material 1 protein C-terminal domain-containing protein n=1 Tax=Romanomermis culicivorax TaxID=13658 RepID=A0A915IU49_ROMCU
MDSSTLQKFLLQTDTKFNNVESPSKSQPNLTDMVGRSPEVVKDNGVDVRLATEGYRMQKQLEVQDTKDRLSKISQLMEELQSDQKTTVAKVQNSSNNRFGTNFTSISNNSDKPYIIDDVVFKNLQDQHCRLNEMKNKLLGTTADEELSKRQQRGCSEEFEFKPRKKSSIDMENLTTHFGHSRRSSSAAANQMATHSQLLFHVQSMMYLLTSFAAPHNNACHCFCKCQMNKKDDQEEETTIQLGKIVQEQQNMMSTLYAWQQELYSQQIKLSQNLNELCAESLKIVRKTNDHQKRKSPEIKKAPDQKVDVETKNLDCSRDDQSSRSYCIEIEDHKNQRLDQQEPQIESVSITVIAPPKVEPESSKTSLQVVKEELENKVKDLLTEVSAVLSENDDLIFNASLLQFVRKLVISLTTIKCLPSVGSYANNNFLKKQLSSILDDTLGKFKGFKVKDCSKEILCDVGDVVFNEVSFFRLMHSLSSTSTSVKEKKKNSLCLPVNDSSNEKFTEKSKSTSCLVGISSATSTVSCAKETLSTAKDCSDEKRTTSVSSLLLRKTSDKDKSARLPITQVTTATDEEEESSGLIHNDDDVIDKLDHQPGDQEGEESRNDSSMIAASSDLEADGLSTSSSDGDLEKFGADVNGGLPLTASNYSCSSDHESSSSSSSMHTASPQGRRYFKINDEDDDVSSLTAKLGDVKERPARGSSDVSDVEIV